MADNETKPTTIAEEAGLGPNWIPADVPPIIPGRMLPGVPVSRTPTNLQGSLPPGFQHDTSFVATEYDSPNVPKFSIMPLGIQGNPMTNAAIQSTAIKSVSSPAPTEDIESVAVNVQSGTSYIVQLSDNNTLVSLTNNAGGTITLPSGLSGGSSSPLAFVQAANANANINPGAASSNTTFTATTGNTIVVITAGTILDNLTNMPVASVTDNQGNVYTQLNNVAIFASGAGQLWNLSIWVATNIVGGSLTVTATGTYYGGGTSFIIQETLEYTPSSVFLFDSLSTQHGSGSPIWTATTPALNTGANVDLLLAFALNQTTAVDWAPLTWDVSYTQRDEYWSVLTDLAFAVADKKTSSMGSYTSSVTTTNGGEGQLTLFAIQLTGATTALLPKDFYCWIENTGTGTFVVSSATNIDGSIQSVSLGPNQGALFVFDGANWYTERGMGVPIPVPVADGGTGRTSLTAHAVLLGEGTSPVNFASPGTSGQVLTSNGPSADSSFQTLPTDTDYYQTVQRNASSKPQEPRLNFSTAFTVTDNPGNTSTDIDITPGITAAVKINGTGVAIDKQFYVNGAADVVSVWGVKINGVADGG
jgi:hypothetical protein